MNRILIWLTAGLMAFAVFAFTSLPYHAEKNSATVNKVDDMFVFTDSKPVLEYSTLGSVHLKFVMDVQYETIRNNLVKQAKRQYPMGDGVILYLSKKGIDSCEVIRFKNR